MSITCIGSDDVRSATAELLGLEFDPQALFSDEGLCAALRRAASFHCPASPRQLVDVVLETLSPLLHDGEDLDRPSLNQLLEALISCGDLLELDSAESGLGRQLYLGPPSFIEKLPGEYRLIGVKQNGMPLLDEGALGAWIWCVGHTRTIALDAAVGAQTLTEAGLHQMTDRQWIQAPKELLVGDFLARIGQLLARAGPSGAISGLEVIDRKSDVCYYKGRWRDPQSSDNGVFVGRRPQAYGSPRWCAVLILSGIPRKLIDFPTQTSTAPSWDDAFRLQAALDSERGRPQMFRIGLEGNSGQIDLFSPVPSWAERYLDFLGDPAPKGRGALFSYRMSAKTVEAASQLLADLLWMAPVSERDDNS